MFNACICMLNSKLSLEKKLLSLLIVILSIFFVCLPFVAAAQVDDWNFVPGSYGNSNPSNYQNTSSDGFYFIAAIVFGVFALLWLIFPAWLIITGKQSKTWWSPKRKMGALLLIEPIVLIVLIILIYLIAGALNFYGMLLLVPIVFLVSVGAMIFYSIKNKTFIAIIPQILLFLFIGALFLLLSMLTLSAGQMQYSAGSGMPNTVLSTAYDKMGYSVGGAKDVANFRANIDENYLPQSSDLTYEGLFYDYYFDTGAKTECTELFCPSYSYALTKDPFSKKDDYYLSVGLNSGMKASDFKRKKLNLVIVLDISGSMGSQFNSYYYDRFRNGAVPSDYNESDEDNGKSKIQIADKSIVALLGHLNPDDRFGMVLFDQSAYLAKPLGLVKDTDIEKLKQHILEIGPQGSTNLEAGLKGGTSLFNNYLTVNQDEYENRIIFLTDAMPNTGDFSEEGLFGMAKANSDKKIYSTFIGMGVDFQTQLIEGITKIRGANYYSVHSASEFKNRMDNEFEFMVTPLVFNLNLKLDTNGFEIEKVYGSPEANEATGQIMKVNTLFPSATTQEGTKGGIVLLKLKKLSPDATMKLKVTYENRTGVESVNEMDITLPQVNSDYFENSGLRKGILLARYADLMKNWLNDEVRAKQSASIVIPMVDHETGIIVPVDFNITLNQWEHQSSPLVVSSEYKKLFTEFKPYFESEKLAIGDETLSNETKILDKLIGN